MASLVPCSGGGRRPSGGGWDFGTPYSSDVWDPLGSSSQLGFRYPNSDDISALAHAHVDWPKQTKKTFSVVRKEDLKVQVEDDNILKISRERIREEEQVNNKWHREERNRGHFMRRFRLPENAILEEIKCVLENGVLTVSLPKKDIQETP